MKNMGWAFGRSMVLKSGKKALQVSQNFSYENDDERESLSHYFIKYKYITQPTVTPVGAIIKALSDLIAVISKQ